MARVIRDRLQGLIAPDPRLRSLSSLWAAESSYDEQTPVVGVPEAAGDYHMVLETAGTQSAGGDLRIKAIQGASGGIDARSGGFAWRHGTDAATEARGWEAPATIANRQSVQWVASGDGYLFPDAVTLTHPDYADRIVAVSHAANTSIAFHWRDADTPAWTTGTVHDGTDLPGYRPCLVEVGRRLYCLHWCRGEASAATFYGIRVHVSEDGGETWAVARRYATIETDVVLSGASGAAEYNLNRLRAAYSNGQVLVIAHMTNAPSSGDGDLLRQYASADLGLRLETIETLDPSTTPAGRHDITVADGKFVVAYHSSDTKVYWRRIGSAFDPLTSGEELTSTATWNDLLATVSGGAPPHYITAADMAMVTDDSGIVWMWVRYTDSTATQRYSVITLYSDDSGQTFEVWGKRPGAVSRGISSCWWFADATDHFPQHFASTWQRGRAVILTNFFASTGTADQSLEVLYLGGYTNLTLPPIREALRWRDRATFELTGLPWERSEDTTSWTAAGGGAAAFAAALTADGEQITTGDGAGTADNRFYARTDAQTGDIAFIGEWTFNASGGATSTAQNLVGCDIRIDDGVTGFQCSVRRATSEIAVYDDVAGTQLGLVTGLGSSVEMDIRVGMFVTEGGAIKKLRVWYRQTDTDTDRKWNFIGAYALVDDGGTVGTNRVRYANIAAGGAGTPVVSTWARKPLYTFGNMNSVHCGVGSVHFWHDWAAANDNPLNLSPRLFSPLLVYVDDGVRVRTIDGPAHEGDEWKIVANAEFPLSRVFFDESRSPRIAHRNTDDASAVVAAWAYDPTLLGTVDSYPGVPVIGLSAHGINWRQGQLDRYTSGAWVPVKTIDVAGDFSSLAYTRAGSSVVPNGDTAYLFEAGELVGWDVRFTGTTKVRRVLSNTEGRWASTGGAGPRCRLILDGIDGTEPTSGNLSLTPRSFAMVINLGATIQAAGWRLTIVAQETVEGVIETGVIVPPAPVWVAGFQSGRGRSLSQSLGSTTSIDDSRIGRSRRRNPSQRTMEMAWPDGVPTRAFHRDAEPNYLGTTDTSGVEGAAYQSATAYSLQSIVQQLDGDPVVWVTWDYSETSGTDIVTLNRARNHMYGSIISDIDLQDVYGDEYQSETLTIGRVSIREEV